MPEMRTTPDSARPWLVSLLWQSVFFRHGCRFSPPSRQLCATPAMASKHPNWGASDCLGVPPDGCFAWPNNWPDKAGMLSLQVVSAEPQPNSGHCHHPRGNRAADPGSHFSVASPSEASLSLAGLLIHSRAWNAGPFETSPMTWRASHSSRMWGRRRFLQRPTKSLGKTALSLVHFGSVHGRLGMSQRPVRCF